MALRISMALKGLPAQDVYGRLCGIRGGKHNGSQWDGFLKIYASKDAADKDPIGNVLGDIPVRAEWEEGKTPEEVLYAAAKLKVELKDATDV